MGKRKHSYLFYNNDKKEKERILNWFNVGDDKIVAFTQNGTYLYVKDDRSSELGCTKDNLFYRIKPSHAFYKLKGGVHNIDVDNASIWYAKYDIDRIEIIMDLN